MKKLLLGLLFLFLPSTAFASSASSTVINNVNTTNTSTGSQTTSHTDITVETNGQTTHYTSDEPNKTIHVESNDGKSKIEVNGQDVSGSEDETSTTPSNSPTPTTEKEIKPTLHQENFLQKLLEQLERPFRILLLRLQR